MEFSCSSGGALRSFSILLVVLSTLSVQAHVGSGANCASCHSSSRNAMTLTGFQSTTEPSAGGLKVFSVAPGGTVPIGIQVIDGRNEYGFALTGLDATGTRDSTHKLLPKPDSTWTKRSTYYSLGPKTGNKTWTFQFGVLTNTPPDLYLISLRIAGDGGGRWNEQESFLVEVRRPAPPVPQLTQPTRTGSSFACRVATVAGYTYTLETQLDPGLSSWIPVATAPGDGTARLLTDPDATEPHAIYRVRVD